MEKTENLQQPDAPRQAPVIKEGIPVYYTNCAMVSTTPIDLALHFGRYAPRNGPDGEQQLVEVYENQLIMTYEQAANLAKAILQTLQLVENAKTPTLCGETVQNEAGHSPQAGKAPTKMRDDMDLELEVPGDESEIPAGPMVHGSGSGGAVRMPGAVEGKMRV
jgi:hypothetical protein